MSEQIFNPNSEYSKDAKINWIEPYDTVLEDILSNAGRSIEAVLVVKRNLESF